VRVALVTHGCRCNQADTDAMAGRLAAAGHEIVQGAAEAEALVLNTCTITARADSDARRQLRALRRAHPGLRLVATGCWATAEPGAAATLSDAVLGNADKADVLAAIESARAIGEGPHVQVSALTRDRSRALSAAPPVRRARALLKVQDGCDYRCAFCIVPSVRGPSRSWTIAEVSAQLERLVAAGVPEIVLTGIHLGTWGRDLRPRLHLSDLVAALLPRLGAARLRLSSIDPHEVDDALLDLLASSRGELCRHLHLPVQSVDEGVLRRMRRGHDARAFVSAVERSAARVPGIAIGTDVITGFPGEDAAAFARTRDRLAALPLSYLHVFSYSERQGTAAAAMDGVVPRPVRAERTRILHDLSQAKATAFASSIAGTLADVVVHMQPDREGRRIGITDNHVRLRLPASVRPGARVAVRVDGSGTAATPTAGP
jgi:threonylcarbamoyladenosine tRNA methylthiotransferase MtaB